MRSGRGAALTLRGPPGIGKSMLLADVCERADGMQLLSAFGVESESELPFAALSTLLRPLLPRLNELGPPHRAALERALAVTVGAAPDRFGIGVATLNLLTLAAEESPVLVTVDDTQWVDAPSADALLFAARRVARDPVVMLFAVREDGGVTFDAPGVPDLPLSGLDRDACRALLEESLRAPLPWSTVDRLRDATGGNPLALVELPSLIDHERFASGDGPEVPVPVGPKISRAFARRIRELPGDAGRALAYAAVSETGDMAEIGGVLRRLGLDSSALAPAEVAGLVRVGAGRLTFRHPLLRAVAYQDMSGPERRIAHLAFAEVLAGDASRARRAWHLAAAVVEPDERTASELEMAAGEAHGRAAPAAAGVALEAAARLSPDDERRVRRLLAAAENFHLAGRGRDAERVLADALARAADPMTRADVNHLRTRVLLMDSPCLAIRESLLGEAERVSAADPVRAASMLIDAAFASLMAGEPREVLALGRRAHPVADRAGGTLALSSCYSLGAGLVLCGQEDEAAPLLARAEALAEAEDSVAAGYLAVSLAQCHNWRSDHVRGRQFVIRLIARARRDSVLTVLPFALAVLAEAHFHLGDWKSAYAAGTESVSLAEEFGQRAELAHSLARLAHVEAGQGREAACREHAHRALELATELQVGSVITLAGTTLGFLELSLGRHDEAIAHLEATGRTAIEAGLRQPGVAMWAVDLAEAYSRAGDPGRAGVTLERFSELSLRPGRSAALAAASRVEGLLAPEDDYVEAFAQALRWHEQTPMPLETARTRLCFGERLREGKRLGEAREMLRAALDAFEALGASRWADHARSALEASGEHRRARVDPASDLTPQELQIAMLVVDGLSNRDAASTLFISPKTVEVHLTHIYRKLGVHSRTQLARELRARSDGAGTRRFVPEERNAGEQRAVPPRGSGG